MTKPSKKTSLDTWSDAEIASLSVPRPPLKFRDYGFRLVRGRGGCSIRVRVFASGNRAVSVTVRDAAGKRRWEQVAVWSKGTADAIRAECLKRHEGRKNDKAKTAAETLIGALDTWYSSEVEKIQIRAAETKRQINRHIRPHDFANRPLSELTHADFTALLTHIESQSTAIVADRVRCKLLTALRYYKDTKDPSYVIPITKAMRRDKREKEQKSRSRVLSDTEIATLWKACKAADTTFSQLVRLALLVPCRSRKLAAMKWSDVNFITRVWNVPKAPREKGVAKQLRLPEVAMQILRERSRVESNAYVFGCSPHGKAFSGFSSGKVRIDELLEKSGTPIADWHVHDCRRSARTLLGRRRLGVDYIISESLLGHKIGTQVAQVYDRSFEDPEFIEDQAKALEALASEIKRIVDGKPVEESEAA
jgi:integrase